MQSNRQVARVDGEPTGPYVEHVRYHEALASR